MNLINCRTAKKKKNREKGIKRKEGKGEVIGEMSKEHILKKFPRTKFRSSLAFLTFHPIPALPPLLLD